MRICPRCSEDNVDEARFCTRCGLALGAPPGLGLDIPRRRRWPIVLAVVLVLAAGAGSLAVWWSLRPDPCADKLVSARYPYCLSLPDGWRAGSQDLGDVPADAFHEVHGTAVVLVAAEDLRDDVSGAGYAQRHRAGQEGRGLAPGPSSAVTLDGAEASAWDVEAASEAGTPLHQRQVVLVRGGTGWLITLAGDEDGYDEAREAFDEMIRTWRWR